MKGIDPRLYETLGEAFMTSTQQKTPNQTPSGIGGLNESTPEHKFAVGDKVKTIYGDGDEYKVKEKTGVNMWGIPEYMLEDITHGTIIYQMENELLELDAPGGASSSSSTVKPWTPKCECGAHKTYGAGIEDYLHSTWCTLYKEA